MIRRKKKTLIIHTFLSLSINDFFFVKWKRELVEEKNHVTSSIDGKYGL